MKKKRLISLIAAFSLVFTGVTAYVPSGVYAEENVQMENLVQGKAAIASSTANGYGPEYAVDGVTSETVQWNSADMKNWGAASGNSKDSEEQTAQWIQIDRGENAEEEDISSIKLWYNVKVWPMEYEIYTADESTLTEGSTDVDLNNWTSLVSVSRPSANGQVANGEGQNIADTSANTDTITAASSPALASDKKLKRYVLMYIRKVNAQAVGNNVNLREIQIFSQNESADVNGTLAGITADSLKVQDGQITVDTGTARGVNAYVRGSSLENVVSNDGQISDYNIGDRNVTLLVRVENKKNPDEYAEKNKVLSVSHNFEQDILACARDINKRYHSGERSTREREEIALTLYDHLKKVHGLNKRDRLLLQIAAILNECGRYISLTNVGESSYNIVMATEMIGLSHLEREIVANIVKYSTETFEYYETVGRVTTLDKESFLKIAKLTAIIRLADGLDISHREKCDNVKTTLKEDSIIITVESNADMTLELSMFARNAELFEEVYNIKPIVKQKKSNI